MSLRTEFCPCVPKDSSGEGIKLHSEGEERNVSSTDPMITMNLQSELLNCKSGKK